MANRIMLLLVMAVLCTFTSQAQYGYNPYPKMELGLSLGMTEFLGDLGGGNGDGKSFISDTDFQFTKPAIGIYYKHHLKKMFSASANLNFTAVQGDDAASGNPGRQARGLSFRSRVLELFGLAHLNFVNTQKVTVHAFGGLGLFHFNPRVEGDADGVSTDFSKNQFMLPMGLGMSYKLTENWVLGADILHRKTFTDFMDGYNSPFTDKNDSYYSLLFKVGYVFSKGAGLGRGGKQFGCPNVDF